MSVAHGTCDPAFAAVGEAFWENLGEELGAAVVVRAAGETVVDLVGGWADAARTLPWRPETVVDVFSTGKAFVALTVLSLGLDLDAPAWQDATLRQVLAHQAGQPAIREELPAEATFDWERIVGALASQEPWWEPGSAHGYHVNTFGFLCGEIVRRASGERLGSRFARLVEGSDAAFGAPPGADVAEFVWDIDAGGGGPDGAELDEAARLLLARAYFNPPGINGLGTVNTPEWRAAGKPSANAPPSARGGAEGVAPPPPPPGGQGAGGAGPPRPGG